MRTQIFLFFLTMLLFSVAWGQTQQAAPSSTSAPDSSMPGMNMPDHDMSKMKDTPAASDKEDPTDGAPAMHSMEGRMDMGPHMKMTALRTPKSGDADRAAKIVKEARSASEKYRDYHAALADGFKIFLPNVPQKMYHFTNYKYAWEAEFQFNPEHPTSLLYEKRGDDYRLIGVMYTAPRRFSEDQLDERVPLSVAQWHEHVNLCSPPADRRREALLPHAQFGLRGSISTKDACDAAGGTFHPVVFNWMVHVYPFEHDPAKAWSVERQQAD